MKCRAARAKRLSDFNSRQLVFFQLQRRFGCVFENILGGDAIPQRLGRVSLFAAGVRDRGAAWRWLTGIGVIRAGGSLTLLIRIRRPMRPRTKWPLARPCRVLLVLMTAQFVSHPQQLDRPGHPNTNKHTPQYLPPLPPCSPMKGFCP